MAEILLLGTASGMPVPNRSHASFLVTADSVSYLFDAGEGCASSLLRNRIDHDRLRAIFISHMHPDHCSGLPMLLQMMYLAGRKQPLEIFLPQEGIEGLAGWLSTTYIFPQKLPFPCTFSPIKAGLFYYDDTLRVMAHCNGHLQVYRELTSSMHPRRGLESYCFVLNVQGRGVVYSGDIASLDDLSSITVGIDLLLLEITHVTVEEAILFASSNGLRRVVLTHVPPELEDKGRYIETLRMKHGVEAFDLATDGLRIPI